MDPKEIELREAQPPLPLMSQEAYGNFENGDLLLGEFNMLRNRSGYARSPLTTQRNYQVAAAQAQAPAGQAQADQGPKSLAELLDLRRRQTEFTNLERRLALREISVDEYKQKVTSLNLSEDERDEAGLFLLQEQGRGGKRKSKKYHYKKKSNKSKSNKRRRSRSNKLSRYRK